jgi:hypothetical protein
MPPGAYSIATGDLNNDGKLDVVVVTDNGFAVALGNGDGTFQPAVSYTDTSSAAVAVPDFNRDGKLDIVVANYWTKNVSVYLGNGDGTFQSPISTSTTGEAGFVVVGDFNNDGKPDVAIIDNPYISVLLGNGDGTFQPPSDNDSFEIPGFLAVGDFNNDHKLDVITVGTFGESYNMGVLLGNGNGTLQNSLTYPLEYVPATVAAGRLENGGNLDAVVGYYLEGMGVFAGNGDGSFQPVVYYNTTGIGNDVVVIGDLNLDGKLDVSVPSTTADAVGVDVFWGNGDGTLQQAQFFATTASEWPVIGDFNGDHLPDFAFVDPTDGITTMLNTGVVSFSPTTAPLTFPLQLVNTTSPKETVNLVNNGTTALSIRSVKFSGQQFQMKSTCGSAVEPGASCSFTGTFKTKTAGTYTGLITIVDSASSKPQFVELTGTATAVKVSPTSLAFGAQKVGTKSAPQKFTATNKGAVAIQFSSVGLGVGETEDFSSTNSCTGPIQPGASCTATVTFKPTRKGPRSATFVFLLPLGSVSPAPVTLSGTGD